MKSFKRKAPRLTRFIEHCESFDPDRRGNAKVYEVTLQRKNTRQFVTVDVLSHSPTEACIRASARIRRELGITDCIWLPRKIKPIAEGKPNFHAYAETGE